MESPLLRTPLKISVFVDRYSHVSFLLVMIGHYLLVHLFTPHLSGFTGGVGLVKF
jgi:hypothetical protein